MIAHEIRIRCRRERRQSPQELIGIEDEARGALGIGPRTAQVIDDAAIRSQTQALLRQRCAQAVAAELLEPVTVVGRDDTRRVQRKAGDLAQRRAGSRSPGMVAIGTGAASRSASIPHRIGRPDRHREARSRARLAAAKWASTMEVSRDYLVNLGGVQEDERAVTPPHQP